MSRRSGVGCRVAWGLAALASAWACTPTGRPWEPVSAELALEAPAVLPLRSQRLPLVDVLVDGRSARALLDTGAESTLIDAGFARRSGLLLVSIQGSVVSRREGEVARVYESFVDGVELALGDGRAAGVRPLVFNMSYLLEGLELIVGMDVLTGCAVLFDAPAGEVRLLPADDVLAHLGDVFAVGTRFTCFPWALDEPRAFLPISFEGVPAFNALIDTGAVFSAFPAAAVATLELEEVAGHTNRHIGGKEDALTYRLPRLDLGGVALTDLDIGTWDEATGILGYAALRNFAFLVDGVGRQFCFAYEPARVDEPR